MDLLQSSLDLRSRSGSWIPEWHLPLYVSISISPKRHPKRLGIFEVLGNQYCTVCTVTSEIGFHLFALENYLGMGLYVSSRSHRACSHALMYNAALLQAYSRSRPNGPVAYAPDWLSQSLLERSHASSRSMLSLITFDLQHREPFKASQPYTYAVPFWAPLVIFG